MWDPATRDDSKALRAVSTSRVARGTGSSSVRRDRAKKGGKTFMKARKLEQRRKPLKLSQPRLSKAELDRLVEEAIVDCYNESEQATGLYTKIEDHLQLPF